MSSVDKDYVTCRRMTVALGTFVAIEARRAFDGECARALDDACAAFEIVESRMHPRTPTGDLAAINAAAPGAPISIHPWTFAVLSLARQMCEASGGLFDPCLPDRPGRMCDVELIAPHAVRRTGPPVSIDLGGIAKGFAIDRAVEALQAAGCVDGLVNAGGDLRVFGSEVRAVDLRGPDGRTRPLPLVDRALAVSGPKTARSPSEHQGFYSPLTGLPVLGRCVAVLAPSAAVADALTKCAIVCPLEALEGLLKRYDAELLTLDSPAA